VVGEERRGGEGVGGVSESEISSMDVFRFDFVGVRGRGAAEVDLGLVTFCGEVVVAVAVVIFLGRPRGLDGGAPPSLLTSVDAAVASLTLAGLPSFLAGLGVFVVSMSTAAGASCGTLTLGASDCKAILVLLSQHFSSKLIIWALFLIDLKPKDATALASLVMV